jgi:hypothetical protein
MKELIIQCGTTYQPLTTALAIATKKMEIHRVHILSTFEGLQALHPVMEQYFPQVRYVGYGDYVSGRGTQSDQAEFEKNIRFVKERLEYDEVFIIASGTNWMTFIAGNHFASVPCFMVQTRREFEHKSFLPLEEPIAVDESGQLVQNDGQVSRLVPIKVGSKSRRFAIEESAIRFLDYRIALTNQEAAMYHYLIENGGTLDLNTDHTESFNRFCQERPEYDNNRALLDGKTFADRFPTVVSKINAKLEPHAPILRHHLMLKKSNGGYSIEYDPQLG